MSAPLTIIGKKYLYHITSRANYLKMLLDKNCPSIHPTLDGCFGKESGLKGIFTTTKENLLQNWGYSQSWNGHLGYSLLCHTAKRKNNLVCLQIPLSSLDTNKIKVRSQNNLFEFKVNKSSNKNAAFYGSDFSQIDKLQNDAFECIYTGGEIPIEEIKIAGRANSKDIAKRLPPKASKEDWFNETIKMLFANC